MMTINSLCLFSITEFLDQLLIWKKDFGKDKVHWSVNILRFPSFMSPLALPTELKEERRFVVKEWLKKNSDNELIEGFEFASLQRLIDYLEVVEEPHKRTSSMESRFRDVKAFFQQYDKRRNKSFDDVFPENLVQWYQSIPETNLSEVSESEAKASGWILDPEDENPT